VNAFEYVRATSWEEAQRALAEGGPGALAKASGIDLIDRMKEGLDAPGRLVSTLSIPGSDAIEVGKSGAVVVGANATLTAMAEAAELARRFPALVEAAGTAANPNVRNGATLAGNLCQRPRCHYYRSLLHPCLRKGGGTCYAQAGENATHALFDNRGCAAVTASSMAIPLVALGAKARVRGADGVSRELPLADLFVPASEDLRREVRLGPTELIEAVVLDGPELRSAYGKVRPRESFDWPIVEAAVAVRSEGGRVADARIVLGAVAMVPWRAKDAEAALVGTSGDADTRALAVARALAGAEPLSGNGHKVDIARALVGRLLTRVFDRRSP
jgi:xanthine dehydrogenase YagS FAD-binding subunit